MYGVCRVGRVGFAVVGQHGEVAALGDAQPCALLGSLQVSTGEDLNLAGLGFSNSIQSIC